MLSDLYNMNNELLSKCNYVTLLIYDNDCKEITIHERNGNSYIVPKQNVLTRRWRWSSRQSLPNTRIKSKESLKQALKRSIEELGLDYSLLKSNLHLIYIDNIGYKSNNNISACFALFDNENHSVIYENVNKSLIINDIYVSSESLSLLTNKFFSSDPEYCNSLRNHIQSCDKLKDILHT